MKGFKLIAIKTGPKPHKSVRLRDSEVILDPYKILNENTIYSFNTNFEFPHGDFIEISFNHKLDFSTVEIPFRGKTIPINFAAIVGANGSGKSTLVELIYWAAYNIGCACNLLRSEKTGKLLTPYKILDIEVLYSLNGRYFKMILNGGNIFSTELKLVQDKLIIKVKKHQIKSISDLTSFFYTIVVNYSLYSLNSKEIGDWIIPLFHKNDGYQTPIVLNPMRDNGNIDINREKYLLIRRLQSNILEDIGRSSPMNSLRNIVNDKIATKLKLVFNPNHYSALDSLMEQKDKELVNNLLKALNKHFELNISRNRLDNSMFYNVSLNYIIEKLIKISNIYRPFRKYNDTRSGKSTIKYIDAYIKRIKLSNSHIIFKVKGVILYLKYYDELFKKKPINLQEPIILDIEQLSKTIQQINKRESFWVNTYMMAPPPFFNVDILLNDATPFEYLSSGEKQRIHSISSIIYHIINLNSVSKLPSEKDDSKDYLSYRNINIILDEIELYYHPEWQRMYINDLLLSIERINPNHIDKIEGINITILTHSPYILSDMPVQNVLKLDKGRVIPNKADELTFGANIHELLTHSFFMTSTIGEFATTVIQDVIEFYNRVRIVRDGNKDSLKAEFARKREQFQRIINNIGEDVIRGMLKNHYDYISEVLEEPIVIETKQENKHD